MENSNNLELIDVLENFPESKHYRHTYPAFRVHRLDKNNPYYHLEGKQFNEKMKEIVLENWKQAKIIQRFDYGLGGLKNLLIAIDHRDYMWFFAVDVFEVVLLNLIPKKNLIGQIPLERICIPDPKYSHSFIFEEKTFRACNTNHAFENFKKVWAGLTLDEVTTKFWGDFEKYISNREQSGLFKLLQIGDVIIVCDYTTEKADLYTTKVIFW